MKKMIFKKTRKGLTLLEVMLVIAFLSIVFFPILEMFSKGFLISQESEATLKATSLAGKTIEEEKNLSYSNLINIPKSAISGFPGFSRQVTVSEEVSNLKDVTVTIYYPVGNSELTITLKTLVANF
jgi:hypothetical protein